MGLSGCSGVTFSGSWVEIKEVRLHGFLSTLMLLLEPPGLAKCRDCKNILLDLLRCCSEMRRFEKVEVWQKERSILGADNSLKL